MRNDVLTLLDDYAARFARGERPEVRAYLARAGAGADELAELIEGFLARASPPPPDEDTVALTAAWIEDRPPLLELRTRRGLTRDAVVDALIAALGLDRAKREKVKRYYHELETGLREPWRVDRRVFGALARVFGARESDLVGWRPRPLAPEAPLAYARAAAPAPSIAVPQREERVEERDEIDRLFGA
jgi:hypothetical protein